MHRRYCIVYSFDGLVCPDFAFSSDGQAADESAEVLTKAEALAEVQPSLSELWRTAFSTCLIVFDITSACWPASRSLGGGWCARQESNLQPTDSKSGALSD
jgi:hypothetical protein